MFGLSIFSIIKGGIIAAIVIVCGYLVWNYSHMKGTIEKQKLQISSLEQQQKVLINKQKNFDAYIKGQQAIKRKVASDVKEDEAAVQSGDPAPVIQRFRSYELRAKRSEPDTPDEGKRSPRPTPAR